MFHPSVRYLYRLTETESVMEKVKRYIDEHRERFVEELFSLLRIPSISADSAHRGDMVRCAEHLRDALLSAGADRAEVMPTDGNPIVYGEKIVDSAAPTVLVYGHYDVMPVDPLDEWKTDPFEPVLRDGRIWGRGADDDKGQSFMHVKALEAMISAGELPCNVKFMIEGEEEIGSASITTWCARHKELLRSDVILVSDTSMLGWDVPSITCGLRGLCYVQVTVTGPDRDLHSGLYGGAVADPAVVLSKMIASLTDADGRVTVPGFYDRVRELSPAERTDFGRAPFCEAAFCKSIGVRETAGEKGYSTMERIGVRPSLDVNGIWGGYTGEGAKTIIPSKAPRENFDAPGTRSGLSRDRPSVRRAFPFDRSPQRPCRRRGAARGLSVRVSDRSARLSRRRPGRRADVRPEASAVLFGRQHPDHQHVREGAGRQVGSARIRARPRRDPLAERELRTRELPARHRDDRLVLPRVRGGQVNAVAPVYKSGHEVL